MATRKQKIESNKRAALLNDNDAQARQEHRMNKGEFTKRSVNITPKTEKQRNFLDGIRDRPISVAKGPAGVGKTFCAASVAAKQLINHEIEEIVLSRANVLVGTSIGLLPGTIEEKMTPLLMPILQVLKRQLGDAMYEYCLRKGKIKMQPFEYIRGMSFVDSFVIVDEAQNLTPKDVIALYTRYESGRIVLLGDPFQHDLEGKIGIEWLKTFSDRHELNIPYTEFGVEDIVRHVEVKKFLTALYGDKKAIAGL